MAAGEILYETFYRPTASVQTKAGAIWKQGAYFCGRYRILFSTTVYWLPQSVQGQWYPGGGILRPGRGSEREVGRGRQLVYGKNRGAEGDKTGVQGHVLRLLVWHLLSYRQAGYRQQLYFLRKDFGVPGQPLHLHPLGIWAG